MTDDDRKGLSRRQLLGAGVSTGLVAAFGDVAAPDVAAQARGATAPATPVDELVCVNGRIHTMDRNNTVATTVSIRNGRFSRVGGTPPRAGNGIRIIDLRGRTVVPGIVDNHNHIVAMGNRPGYHTPLENAASIADVQAILSARAKSVPSGAWITTIGGFHRNHLVPP